MIPKVLEKGIMPRD